MKANKAQIAKALGAPPPDIRLFLLYGPDEAGSMALYKRLEKAMGEGAERIDLDGPTLRADPARLSDEAASLSMFGDTRWIRISGAGEESVSAIEALLSAPQAGNVVIAIAGAIKNTSKLAKLCLGHPAAMAFASYAPNEAEAAQIAITMGQEQGLQIAPDLARRIAESVGNDRALIAGEIEKLVLYSDASPAHPVRATDEAFDALSAQSTEVELGPLINAVFGGHIDALHTELATLAASGTSLAAVTRPLISRAMLIGQIHVEVERQGSLDRAIDAMGKAIFFKEAPAIRKQAHNWPADTISRLMHRLLDAERGTRDSKGPGEIAVRQELLTIARQAVRNR